MALEACVAWEGLHRGRRVGEVARRGPGASSRVGKNEILVKRRGVPDGLFQGGAGGPLRVVSRGLGAAVERCSCRWGHLLGRLRPRPGGPAYPGAVG
jgi:hypothetical protein